MVVGSHAAANQDVMNDGQAVMNSPFSTVQASDVLTHVADARIVPAVSRRRFIPAPLLFVIATAFGISSTFQAYWMDRLSPHTHPMQDAVLHHNPVGAAVGGVEEVAVDARHGRGWRGHALDPGQALLTGDRVVGEHRIQAPQPSRPRRHQHVDDDGPVGREQELARVVEARDQRLRGRVRRRGEDARQQHCDEDPAQQNLTPREGSAIT